MYELYSYTKVYEQSLLKCVSEACPEQMHFCYCVTLQCMSEASPEQLHTEWQNQKLQCYNVTLKCYIFIAWTSRFIPLDRGVSMDISHSKMRHSTSLCESYPPLERGSPCTYLTVKWDIKYVPPWEFSPCKGGVYGHISQQSETLHMSLFEGRVSKSVNLS